MLINNVLFCVESGARDPQTPFPRAKGLQVRHRNMLKKSVLVCARVTEKLFAVHVHSTEIG